MNSTNNGRRIFVTPVRLRQRVALFGIRRKQMSNWGWLLLEFVVHFEHVHLVVFLADLIRQTARPCLDAVEGEFLFVVPRLTNIDFFVSRKASRAAFVVPSMKHDEAAVHNIVGEMVSILTSLHDFILVEALRHAVDRLLWTVVPARVDPLLASLIPPKTVNLRHDWFLQVVRIANMNPIA